MLHTPDPEQCTVTVHTSTSANDTSKTFKKLDDSVLTVKGMHNLYYSAAHVFVHVHACTYNVCMQNTLFTRGVPAQILGIYLSQLLEGVSYISSPIY